MLLISLQRKHLSGLCPLALTVYMGNESVPIQLAQCRFPGLAISNDKILIGLYFSSKNTEAILSNSTRKLLWFEIAKMLIAV